MRAVGGTAPSFRILGSLECRYQGAPLPLGGALRQRALATLLLEANRVVPVGRLVDAVWDEDPPSSARHQIRKIIAELRRRIPDGARLLVTEGPGYRATLGEEQLDVIQYRARARRAREAMIAGDHVRAVHELRTALELWRGPVMDGMAGRLIAEASAALEEQHLVITKQLYELRLANGESAELVGELRALVNQYPLYEALRGQLMLALYRAGRQADALEEFARLRTLLNTELGIDPCASVTELYEDILQQSPVLAAFDEPPHARAEVRPPAPPVRPPSALPYTLRDFSGRESELRRIVEDAGQPPESGAHIIAIDGMGGSGKTALAVHAAHALTPRYPDGQLFVDLGGFTPGQQPLGLVTALDALLSLAGVPTRDLPSDVVGRVALWRALTTERRMLILLDNAADTEQVRPLIPASPHCLTLITSRPRQVDLDGARWLSLDVFSAEESIEMLRRTLGPERVAHEPEASRELARLCGHLPLAIRIATARLRNRSHWTIRRLADRLGDDANRLGELDSAGRSVAAAVRLSYQAMDLRTQSAFRLLGLYPGRGFDTHDAAALLGCSAREAEGLLEQLVDSRLLDQRAPGWHRFHDLVRSFAIGLLGEAEQEAEEREALARLLNHYAHTAEHACALLLPDRPVHTGSVPPGVSAHPGFADPDEALSWLDSQRDSLLRAVDTAHRQGFLHHTSYLPRALVAHAGLRGSYREVYEATRTAVVAARRLGDLPLLTTNLVNLGVVQCNLGMYREAAGCLREALKRARALGDRHHQATSLMFLGYVHKAFGEFREARPLLEEAAADQALLGNAKGEAESLSLLGSVRAKLGDFTAAIEVSERAMALYHHVDNVGTAVTLSHLAAALCGVGRVAEAVERLEEALRVCARLREPTPTIIVLAEYAHALVRAGRAEEAREQVARGADLVWRAKSLAHRAVMENCAGRVHRALGEWSEALNSHQRGYQSASEIQLRYEMAAALSGLAEASARLGKQDDADDYRARADELYEWMSVPPRARR